MYKTGKQEIDKTQFLKEMYYAYLRVIAVNTVPQGSPIAIYDLYPEIVVINNQINLKKSNKK